MKENITTNRNSSELVPVSLAMVGLLICRLVLVTELQSGSTDGEYVKAPTILPQLS